ncbi:RNA polymerase sigma factor [Pararcticibacter amylolyticus]|uniref:RNA polymerase sigma-70 factor n=1 Tax=Pararcticibacter amylolyticus TaxID=2173175 RepID=A0A2U2PJE0_9SPHI|nr:RNA polymerase sigma-70 factor [Pararcticibacter amylolyticus]PWG81515.1 hypothetical protein DDR33_06700 [Pararcticibacter amylolyticus]
MIDLALNGGLSLVVEKEETAQDTLLLQRISEGDEKAFAALFYQYLPVLMPFVSRFTKCEYGTEEVIQNTFIRVWMNREKLERVNNIKAWLYRYASNESLNYLRSSGSRKNTEYITHCSDAFTLHSECTSQHINLNEVRHLVAQAVGCLSEQRRKIYIMSRNEDLSIPEIAAQLGISPNTVKNTLVASLKSVRQYLSLHGYHFSLLFFLFFKYRP